MLTFEDVNKEWKVVSSEKPIYALSKLILSSHKSKSHISAIVFGKKRVGKSVYSLKVMEDVFRCFGLNEQDAWRYSLNSLVYTMRDFLLLLDLLATTNYTYPVITIDDAGVGFSHLLRFSPEADALKGVFDTIGILVSGIIYTTPNPKELLNFVRDADSLRIKITIVDKEWRKAWGVKSEISNIGDITFTEDGGTIDDFRIMLDDWKYAQYEPIRKNYARQAIKKALDVVLRKGKEKEEEKIEEEKKFSLCSLCSKEFLVGELTDITGDGRFMLCQNCYKKYLSGRSIYNKT